MKRLLISLLIMGAVWLTACNAAKSTPTVDIEAQITQTMQAVATDAQSTLQAAVPTPIPATNTPLPTGTPLPTETPAPTATPMPVMTETESPTATSTSGAVAFINENTNCRSGPSTNFPVIFTALKGDSLNIVSKSTLDDYVVVEVPNAPGQTCWLWTEYVTVQGDVSTLPVATPPPTPTPAVVYSISYLGIEPCTGYSLAFKVINTGAKPLQSYSIMATDQSSGNVETTDSNVFTERVSCKLQEERALLDPGQSGYIYGNDFSYDPKGHSFLVYLTICSNNDLEGECVSQGFIIAP
jgi:uncharacterized protein YraI